jgi:hypothetical protein
MSKYPIFTCFNYAGCCVPIASSQRLQKLFGMALVLFCCMLPVSISAARAQSEAANQVRVEGTVHDSSGASVSTAQVTLKSGTFSATMPVTPSGDFVFENVPGTSGTITVTANAFQKVERTWNSSPPKPVRLDIILVPLSLNQQIVVTGNRTPHTGR